MSILNENDACKSLPLVALDFMNIVHCEEVLLTQGILQALESEPEASAVDRLVSDWVEHTIVHFAREERLMEEYRFPPFGIHQHEHTLALETLRNVEANWLTTRDAGALANYIEHDWQNWLMQHISTLDRVTAAFLAQFDIQVDLDLD